VSLQSGPLVSVVVASIGRPESLAQCIDSVSRQLDVSLEIIVVVGPGGDDTARELHLRPDVAIVARNPDRNLSRSRNIGLSLSSGAFVAYLDDDAIASERWLAQLIGEFDDPEVVEVGGEVFDYTGVTHQARYSRCTRAGDSTISLQRPLTGLTETPAASTFTYPIGTNMVFRAEALRNIGGFDEQYDYFHDETDAARRLLDSGGIVRVVERGGVIHRFLPSDIRGAQRIALERRSILVNRAYFAVRHQLADEGITAVRRDFSAFVDKSRREIENAVAQGIADEGVRERHETAIKEALARLDVWVRAIPQPKAMDLHAEIDAARKNVVVHRNGSDVRHFSIATLGSASRELIYCAESLASAGNIVRVLDVAGDHATVDLENGVWRHRLVPNRGNQPTRIAALGASSRDALALSREIDRIAKRLWPLDVVVVDDSSGLASALEEPGRRILTVDDFTTTSPEVISNLLAHRDELGDEPGKQVAR
jgi:hypothetical protein